MMSRYALLPLVLFSSVSSFASAPQVDCSQAAKGKVTITSTGDRLELVGAAKLAYSCFAKRHPVVTARINNRLASLKRDGREYCRPEAIQALTLESSMAGRPSGGRYLGGDGKVLIQHPMVCGPEGTGLFEGIAANAMTTLSVSDSTEIDLEDDSVLNQTVLVEFVKASKLDI